MKKKYLLMIFLLILFVCNRGYCITEIEENENKQEGSTTDQNTLGVMSSLSLQKINNVMKSTGIVIVVIVITVFFLRKKIGIKAGIRGRKRYVHIVDTIPLGSKKYIHLVKVPGKVLLIGAAGDRIQSLTEIIEKDIVESIDTEPKSSEFMKFFKRAYTERT